MATYYVDPNLGQDGTNGHNGTSEALAWNHIQYAHDQCSAGDTIILMDGEYTGSGGGSAGQATICSWTKSGSSGNYITVKAKNRFGAKLHGHQTEGADNGTCFAFVLGSGASYVKFQDMEFLWFRESPFWMNDNNNPSSYIWIEGNKFHDIGRIAILDGQIGGGVLYIGYGTFNHIYFIRNLCYRIGRLSSSQSVNKDHVIYSGGDNGSYPTADHIYYCYNITWEVSGNHVELHSHNDVIANNVMAWSTEKNGQGNAFIQIVENPQATKIMNNIFYQPPPNNNYGILAYASLSQVTIKGNFIWNDPRYVTANILLNLSGASPAVFVSNHGDDADGPKLNPLFVYAEKSNEDASNWHLAEGSPCVNAGFDTGETWITKDIEGNTLTGTLESGAYIFAGGTQIWYNVAVSQIFQKNDCQAGYHGSSYIYSVAAGKYSSFVSQQDADQQAADEITANGQAAANNYGTCLIDTVPNAGGDKLPYWYYAKVNGSEIWESIGGVIKKTS